MTILRLLLIAGGTFLLWGGFFVNIPVGNYFWFAYDMFCGFGSIVLAFVIPAI